MIDKSLINQAFSHIQPEIELVNIRTSIGNNYEMNRKAHDQEEIFDKIFTDMGYKNRYDALQKARIVKEFGLYWSVLGSADCIFVK